VYGIAAFHLCSNPKLSMIRQTHFWKTANWSR